MGLDNDDPVIVDGPPQKAVVVGGATVAFRPKLPFGPKNGGRQVLTIESLAATLAELGIIVRYNVISKDILINIPRYEASPDNAYDTSRAIVISALKQRRFDTGYVDDFLLAVAEGNKVNIVQDWVLGRPWDGTKRLASLFATIDAEDNNAKEVFLFRWLVTCIAAAFEPQGITAAGMVVLQGEQRIGKTYWFRKLFPDFIRQEVFKDGLSVNTRDKDSVKIVMRNWVCELGEVGSTFRKSDIEELKNFITRGDDVIRLPYGRREKSLPRRTALCATVNDAQYLVDKTGNGRFWTIACKKVDSYHSIDMQQLWAEVYSYYKDGEKWALAPAELDLVNSINQAHQVEDYCADKVGRHYNWRGELLDWKTAGQIAEEMGIAQPRHGELISIAMAVLMRNGKKKRRSNGNNLLLVPARQL